MYDSTTSSWINAYMPRVNEGAQIFPGFEIDSNRFMCKTFDQINGIYKNAFEFFEIGKASAGAYILFVIILLLTVIQWKTRKLWVFNEK